MRGGVGLIAFVGDLGAFGGLWMGVSGYLRVLWGWYNITI